MTNRDIILQLQFLQKINPAPDWQSFCRQRIISKIRFEKKPGLKPGFVETWFHIFHPQRLVLSFSSVIVILMIILLGGLGAAGAAYYSLPGETLYPVKLKLSRALLFLPGQSDSNKLKQQVEIVRLVSNDLTEVIKTGGDNKAVEKAVAIIKEEVDLTNQHLNKMTDKPNTQKVKVAQTIKETSDKLRKSLNSTKKVLSSQDKVSSNNANDNLVKTLAKASAAAQDVKLKSLKMIAEKAESENGSEEVNKELLAQDIALVIAEAEQDLLLIITADGEQKIIKNPKTDADDNTAELDEILKTAEDNQLSPAQADNQTTFLIQENLAQAKESLANNQLEQAIDKVAKAISIAHQTEKQEAENQEKAIDKLEIPSE